MRPLSTRHLFLYNVTLKIKNQAFCNPTEHAQKERFPELPQSRQLIMPLELLLPFALVDVARLLSTPPLSSCQSVTSLTLCVAKYLCACMRRASVRRPYRRLYPPPFPTSHLRLVRLCSAQVSQSSAEGQTDFSRQ